MHLTTFGCCLRWGILFISFQPITGFVQHTAFAPSNFVQPWSLSSLSLAKDDGNEYVTDLLPVDGILRSMDPVESRHRYQRKSNTAASVSTTTTTELSPYYRRDRRDYENDPNVGDLLQDIADPDGLRQLLQERYHARRRKEFIRVKDMDQQLLRQHNVRVYDHPPIWTCLSSASLQRRRGGGGSGGVETAPPAQMRRRLEKKAAHMKQLYGPLQHPYRRVGRSSSSFLLMTGEETYYNDDDDDGSSVLPQQQQLPEPMVHDNLSRLVRCRLEGRDEEADAIRFELSLFGIRVDETRSEWTTDDEYEFDSTNNEQVEKTGGNASRLPVVSYTERRTNAAVANDRVRFGGRTSEEDQLRRRQRVNQLIEQRLEATARGSHSVAWHISLELAKTYDVLVDDATCSWWIDPNARETVATVLNINPVVNRNDGICFPGTLFGNEARSYDSTVLYQKSSQSLALENESWSDRINYLLLERINKREEGRLLEADAIRRELWYSYHVGVNDRLRQFSVGGVFDRSDSGRKTIVQATEADVRAPTEEPSRVL